MLILAIETSCDETAAAIVKDGDKILSNIVSSQIALHAPYGGVVPEIASRAHIKQIIPVIKEALKEAKIEKENLDVIAVTQGPGLLPALMIGVDTARTLAFAWKKPLIGINHIEGHIFSIKLKAKSVNPVRGLPLNGVKLKAIKFPAVCLTVSGGHTMLILVKDWGNYEVIGETLDDACGEAFDKVAKLLDLGYPGGPAVEEMAQRGNPQAFAFPRPIIAQKNFDFSFSGLKTAVLYEIKKMGEKLLNKKIACPEGSALADSFRVHPVKSRQAAISPKVKLFNRVNPVKSFAYSKRESPIPFNRVNPVKSAKGGAKQFNRVKDICASFQAAAFDVLITKTLKAADKFQVKTIMLTGGVAANKALQSFFKEKSRVTNYELRITYFPTDNAAMIAVAAYPRAIKKDYDNWRSLQADANLKLET